MSVLVDSIFKRGQLKANLTRFSNFVKKCQENPENNLIQLPARLTKIKTILDEFEEIQGNIEILDKEEKNKEDHLRERIKFEDDYFQFISEAETLLNSPTNNASSENTSSVSSIQVNKINTDIKFKLPHIEVPQFSGLYEDWIPFKELFTAIVCDNPMIEDIHKLYFLRQALKGGSASNLINGIELKGSNYKDAWELLVNRYQNERVIIEKHLKGLFDQPKIDKESHTALRKLIDITNIHLKALSALKQPIQHWDSILIHFLVVKLDFITCKEWQEEAPSDRIATFEEFITFLDHRCRILEAVASTRQDKPNTTHQQLSSRPLAIHPSSKKRVYHISENHPSKNISCPICRESHKIFTCPSFSKLTPKKRLEKVMNLQLCLNCLRSGHFVKECRLFSFCKHCGKKHNSLIHLEPHTDKKNVNNDHSCEPQVNQTHRLEIQENRINNDTPNLNSATVSFTSNSKIRSQVLLSTAIIEIAHSDGSWVPCRALLDPGSSLNIISAHMSQQLKLPGNRLNTSISGIGEINTNANYMVSTKIKSRFSAYETQLNFVVLRKVTNHLPISRIDITNFNIPRNIFLADPTFYVPNRIDVLIGAEIFYDLLCVGQIRISNNSPTLQKTNLGWIVAGRLPESTSIQNTSHVCLTTTADIGRLVENFWNIEELNQREPKHTFTGEDELCEKHFCKTVSRLEDGHYMVQLPFKQNIQELGSSREIALKRFYQLEKRLLKNESLRIQYCQFMREYEELHHMEVVDMNNHTGPVYYIPHHAVLKHDSSTTKLRVVFDASCKTDRNNSLNDCLMVGPVVQDDLFSIIVRFRKHTYVLTADIEKMYRQIQIHPDHTRYQLIFWRDDPSKPIRTFKLLTVTYGTASAPFLATRALKHLINEKADKHTHAVKHASSDFYVDDILTGANTIKEACELQEQLKHLLLSGGFNLRKWCSNCPEVLYNIDPQDREINLNYNLKDDCPTIKTLGVYWNAQSDVFRFSVKTTSETVTITKRRILSEIASLFDPLGLVGPVILKAKIILQELWKLKLSWDESIPLALNTEWLKLKHSLSLLNNLNVPRHIILEDSINIQLHTFSDASTSGYGACVYIRSENSEGCIQTTLICSKTRVAPLKKLTMPRLELCGALLASRLTVNVLRALKLDISESFHWTDSTIVLSWIKSKHTNWNTFVSNRISQIQSLTSTSCWRHTKGIENPADLASRGTNADNLIHSQLWWNGPPWLSGPISWNQEDTSTLIQEEELPEYKENTINVHHTIQNNHFIYNYSSFTKIQNIVAYMYRFINNTRRDKQSRFIGPLALDELNQARFTIIRIIQEEEFSSELKNLRNNAIVSSSSKLASLSPFLDKHNIIRVGGRLQNANLSYGQRHPIVLPAKNRITYLIVRNEHFKNLHIGPQSLLAAIRLEYWPINGRNIVKKVIHECLICFRAKPKPMEQLMGALPEDRVNPKHAFSVAGIDYCGPLDILSSHRRGAKITKGYIVVFICLVTRAIHLELVQDMTTNSFIAALQRFIARRGKCKRVWTDNAKNFIGAKNEMERLSKLFSSEIHQQTIQAHLSSENIDWKFIPPRSPHFGGLWEAGVKSVKYHLVRILGQTHLTYEDLYTILCKIEGVLNSRPISPLSSDPSDTNYLTPGHFLIGQPLIALPERDETNINVNRLTKWRRTTQVFQHFWDRWRRDYISEMQTRVKWKKPFPNLTPGTLVLIHEDNIPPTQWKVGRVIETISGQDGRVRVVVVKTATSILKRSITKVCPLPLAEQLEESR